MAKKGTFIIGIVLILGLVTGLYQYQAVQDQNNVIAYGETEEQKREGAVSGFDDETELIRYLFYQVQQDDLDLALRACAIDNLAENFLLRSYIEFTGNYEGVNTLPPSDDESSAYMEISNARLAAHFAEQLQQCREIFGSDHQVKLLHVEEEMPENPDGKYYTDRQSICDILGSAKVREMKITFETDGQTKEMVWTLARYRKNWQVVSFNAIADGEKRPIKVLAAKAEPDWTPIDLNAVTEIPDVNYTVVAQNSEETPEELLKQFLYICSGRMCGPPCPIFLSMMKRSPPIPRQNYWSGRGRRQNSCSSFITTFSLQIRINMPGTSGNWRPERRIL